MPSLIDPLAACRWYRTRYRVLVALVAWPLAMASMAVAHAQMGPPPYEHVGPFYAPAGPVVVAEPGGHGMGEMAEEGGTIWTTSPDWSEGGQPVFGEGLPSYPSYQSMWGWQILPDGLIYRSYLAGPRESKMQLNMMEEIGTGETYWDVILGGRRGLLRYGSGDPLKPEGWQLDIEGGTILRLNLDHERDLDASDFRFGVPLTYGWGKWQYKIGYYHLSSHLGDELIVRTTGATRVNYVRDAIIVGLAYNPTPAWRLYGEAAYAFFTAGGAEPWEFQFGVEYAQPGPTDIYGTPFFATNGHLREEIDFGGDYALQLGWLWRGESGSTFRTGFQFLTGHSNLYQFYNESEEQYGWAIWYDF